MKQTVIGVFKSADDAQEAVEQLLNNGFTESNVDVSSNNSTVNDGNSNGGDSDKESGISKFFKHLFGDDDERERYTKAARRGSVVTVHTQTSEEAQRASELLDQYGATDVDDNYKEYSDSEAGNNFGRAYKNAGEGETVSVIEEKMQVGKREVETGGVRLKSRIVEKPVEESLRLREEHVSVERKPVDRAATDADLNNFKEETIELVEHAEVPVVSKESRIVEEVSLGKKVDNRKETIRDSVRKTEVDVEHIESDKKNSKSN